MARVIIPDENKVLLGRDLITNYLQSKGVWYDVWETPTDLTNVFSEEEILKAYDEILQPFMQKNGYKTADVINISNSTENLEAIRLKFLKEHTHTEDEVRFFVDGRGYFWFNIDNENVFCAVCEKGDLISVPAGVKHWFDLGDIPKVKAIRIFIDTEGWVPQYTHSGIDEKYLK